MPNAVPKKWPWLDRKGQLSPLKLAVLIALTGPAFWLGWLVWQGELGPRPIMEAIHFTGLWAIRILLLSLLVTPLRQIFRWPRIMLVRRMVGLGALAYATCHLVLYCADLQWNIGRAASEIALRSYLTIGFVALLGLSILGFTSTDGWIRRLGGRKWRRLHRIVYGIAVLALLHFALQSKLDVTEAMLTTGLFLWLVGYRMLATGNTAISPTVLTLLGIMATAGTAFLEATWYRLSAGAPLLPVLTSNFDSSLGPRPAVWVGIAGLGLAALSCFRRRNV